MKKDEATTPTPATVIWTELESFIRSQIQTTVQSMLEHEVAEYLGRQRYERGGLGRKGYRNGLGKPRRVVLSCGTIEVQRPRLRDLEERFESAVLPLFAKQSKKVSSLMPQLYLEGLALRDFDRALRGLFGTGAPLSPSSIARLKEHWRAQYEEWSNAPIVDEIVYVWADGVYVRAGLEKDKAAVLVVIGVTVTGQKRVLAVESGYRESTESWKEVFHRLQARGMNEPRVVVADGAGGIWAAVAELGWRSIEQRCWNHKLSNVKDALPLREHPRAMEMLRPIPRSQTREEAEAARDAFVAAFSSYPKACERLCADWERMVGFYRLPKEHWRSLRTTNVVESPFQVVRLRTGAARRFKKVENAVPVIWKLLLTAEAGFKRLDASHLLEAVARGQEYLNGIANSLSRRGVA